MSETKETKSFTPDEEHTKLTGSIVDIKVYKKRWAMLGLFILLIISSTIQNMQYIVVADVIKTYYQISYLAIDWTTMLSPLLGLLFTIPGNYAIDKLGIRKTLIIASIGTAIGSWIKIASIHPDRFWIVLVGHGVVGLFQLCYGPLVPRIVATWFGYNQIATACGLAVSGFEAGTSLSFLLPPLVIVQGDREYIEKGLFTITLSYAIFTSLLILFIIFYFSEKPKLPPSYAQSNFITKRETTPINFREECRALITNRNYLLFMVINGISIASVISLENLSNQIILAYYPDAALHVGIIGVIHVFSSLLGAIGCSMVLDKYKQFKLITRVVYGFLLLSLILFAATIKLGLFFVYASLIILGVLLGSMFTLSVEIVVELTYPQSQIVAMGLFSICGNVSIIMLTSLYGYIHRNVGNNWANITIITITFAADLLFFILKFDLRRKAEELEMSNKANCVL